MARELEFSGEPLEWTRRVVAELAQGRREVLGNCQPASWTSPSGHPWRLVMTDGGIEMRAQLVAPFLQFNDAPMISAIAIGSEVDVEITTRDGRWVDRFPLGTFDVVAAVEAMLDERRLPHDNLPRLFPLRSSERGELAAGRRRPA